MVSLSMVGELKDIILVSTAVERAGDRLRPNMRRAFRLLNGIRRWVFLPSLLGTVPFLVLYLGGVCFYCNWTPSLVWRAMHLFACVRR